MFHYSVPGVVIAVYGHENENGKFEVDESCFVDLPSPDVAPNFDDDR